MKISKKYNMCVAYLRLNHNLTQQELANIAHIEQSAISDIENGKRGLSLEIAMSLSKAFNITIDELLSTAPEVSQDDNAFFTRLKVLIYECDSMVDFADKCNITRQNVGHYINEHREPRMETIIKIAKAMNVSTDWLLGLTTERRKLYDS